MAIAFLSSSSRSLIMSALLLNDLLSSQPLICVKAQASIHLQKTGVFILSLIDYSVEFRLSLD
jgi:hypothetical protein